MSSAVFHNTATVYNYIGSAGETKLYKRTVLKYVKSEVTLSENDGGTDNKAVLFIPIYGKRSEVFLSPDEWREAPSYEGYYTLMPGDFFVLGTAGESYPPSGSFTVVSCSLFNEGTRRIQHIKAIGKIIILKEST